MDVRLDVPPAPQPDATRPPRLSVIVPVYNDPLRLAKCLTAIKASTFSEYEVIVADDGSTDRTPQVAEAMGARVVRLPRQSGAAAARNSAAAVARGDILLFIDADVCVHPDTLAVAETSFQDPAIHAVFGSYDLEPAQPNLLSQYKNLAHRFYHQISNERVSTFWTGCGAMRRQVFDAYKFDAQTFKRPSIEDIDLGARITRDGKKIVINKKLQATHLKHWTLLGIVKSDLFDRAIPWTQLIHRQRDLPGDLNLGTSQRLAAMLTAMSAAIFGLACCFLPWLLLVPPAVFGLIWISDRISARGTHSAGLSAIAGGLILVGTAAVSWYARWWMIAIIAPLIPVLLVNHRFYRFFLRHRGLLFALMAIPMQLAYYLYSLVGFAAGTALHWRDNPAQFDDSRFRRRIYVTIAIALYAMSWGLVLARAYVRNTTVDFAVSDAMGYYVYLPSLVIDGDLKFQNQLDIQSPITDEDYSSALENNRWPTGIALSIAPAFLAAHGICLAFHAMTGSSFFAPHGYSPLYFAFCVAWAMGLGTIAMMLIDRLVVDRFGIRGVVVTAAVVTTWLGTNFLWYFAREPLLAHMVGASWVIYSVFLIHRIERHALDSRLIWWELPLLAFSMSMALVCRLTNAYLAPVFVYLLIVLIRNRLILQSLKLAPLCLLALAPLVFQYFVQEKLQGQVVISSVQAMGYGKSERFYFTQPALLRTLFSSKHGLFFATPTLILAAWGIIRYLIWPRGRRDPLVVAFALSALILWYINAAWWAWWFGPSVGHRGFVELAGLWVIGFAFAFTLIDELQQRKRRIILGLLVAALAVNYAMMGMKLLDIVDDNQTLIPWEDEILKGRWRRI